ncbi:tRNA (adenosine(37)-N6)-dimethylallyltransferase MiaA [Altibacter sp. HG106]|uniref:tRNA (adenosine(37)-N6)-dimethylallyltransferase MiaA n=1 Tax=Altibacter sp. HG106 TaxID=3023937 RepID=UPI00234FFC27|nr:tRNA (adenosine(37)-N6)-dimethylallyltransferase MiaA [Altibacter sp. HG106]MDC7995576.1 tRNA (adenosine(37)-N6)-dimethylallyltransferase MiaA [Altibacter sp. HG106]
MPPKPLLIAVVGPTAIGKTRIAIALAKAFQSEIISADSRQFFKEMRIGTAVPTSEELEAIPHHCIQHKSIHQSYNVGDFETEALTVLEQLFQRHQIAIMVGGSGLYVDAVVNGLDHFPEVPKEVRDVLMTQWKRDGIEALQHELQATDPDYYEGVDINNPHRLIRALEIIRATGQPFSSYLHQEKPQRPFETRYIGLTAPRETVYDRINQRVDAMLSEGLIEEARKLFPYRSLNALQTVGYKELFQYFEGHWSFDKAIAEIKKNTRRFAKRQGTWFRKNETIQWFEHTVAPEEIAHAINEKNA